MKVEITLVSTSKSGILKIKAETPIEAYALYHWWDNFNMGDHSSIFTVDYDNFAPHLTGEVEK
jgi:hypothetical protein